MKVSTKELFKKTYSKKSVCVHFSTVDEKAGVFIVFYVDKEDDEVTVFTAANYFQLFHGVRDMEIEDAEATNLIESINHFQEEWAITYEMEYLEDYKLIERYKEFVDNTKSLYIR